MTMARMVSMTSWEALPYPLHILLLHWNSLGLKSQSPVSLEITLKDLLVMHL